MHFCTFFRHVSFFLHDSSLIGVYWHIIVLIGFLSLTASSFLCDFKLNPYRARYIPHIQFHDVTVLQLCSK